MRFAFLARISLKLCCILCISKDWWYQYVLLPVMLTLITWLTWSLPGFSTIDGILEYILLGVCFYSPSLSSFWDSSILLHVLFVPFHCYKVFHYMIIPPSLSTSRRGRKHQVSPSLLPAAIFVLGVMSTAHNLCWVVQHTTWAAGHGNLWSKESQFSMSDFITPRHSIANLIWETQGEVHTVAWQYG